MNLRNYFFLDSSLFVIFFVTLCLNVFRLKKYTYEK